MWQNFLKKPDRLSVLLFFLFILFISIIIWTHTAPLDVVRIFYYYQLDKIVHFLAGWWVIALLFAKLHLRRGKAVFLLILAVAWELFEFAVFPDVRKIYNEKYIYWLTDTLGDLGMDFLGGMVAFWAFSGKNN